jgi:hypothetical protein
MGISGAIIVPRMKDRAEHWIGAGIAGWFCFVFAGLAALGASLALAVPAALYMAGQSEAVASLGARLRVALPGALALTSAVIGLIGLLGGRH